MVSKKFYKAIKLASKPQYKIAWEAGIHPTVLSQMVNGYIKVNIDDPRIISIGRLLGLSPEECFELDSIENATCSSNANGNH